MRFGLQFPAIKDSRSSRRSSAFAVRFSASLSNGSSELISKSTTRVCSSPPISVSKEACGSMTTNLYFCLRSGSFATRKIRELMNFDLPEPEEPTMTECLAKLKSR